MQTPEPGVYPGVDFDQYAVWDAANHSVLRHFNKTPAHVYWEITHQAESTTFQALGHLIHFAVLEPDRFKTAGPVVAPKLDRRTTAGKISWQEFLEANVGRPIVTADEMEILQGIQRSIVNHATAREALYGFGNSELSIVWDEPVGDDLVRCKGRIDRICEIGGYPVVLDIKTMSKPAATQTFERSINEYGYHQQAAFYLRGLAKLVPPDEGVVRQFMWLVCETVAPYCVRLFQAEDAALDLGAQEIDRYLAQYAECKRSNTWPAWPEGVDIAGLPPYVYKRFDIE